MALQQRVLVVENDDATRRTRRTLLGFALVAPTSSADLTSTSEVGKDCNERTSEEMMVTHR